MRVLRNQISLHTPNEHVGLFHKYLTAFTGFTLIQLL